MPQLKIHTATVSILAQITVDASPVGMDACGMTAPPYTRPTSAAGTSATAGDARPGSLLGGVVTMLVSGLSNQVGAAVGAHAFGSIGPAGVVAVRQVVAAAVLLPVARPSIRQMTWAQWWPTLLLAAVFACMNIALYTAIDRIGLGLAVTLEFLGPLGVALAASRTRVHLLAAVSAAVGVYVLVLPGPSSDYLGIGLALLAAACWAAYILLNRLVGARLPGLQAPAVATSISALLYLPVLFALGAQGRLSALPLVYAITTGVLSSVVPYAADLTALRHVPARFFGTFMSIHPVWAALAGLAVLGQVPATHEWIGIGVVALSNAVAVITAQGGHRLPAVPRNQGETRYESPVAIPVK
jgi:inner membrane transporter RhtA